MIGVFLMQETFNAETYLRLEKVPHAFPSLRSVHSSLPTVETISTRASPGDLARNRFLLNAFHFLKKFNYASSYRARARAVSGCVSKDSR